MQQKGAKVMGLALIVIGLVLLIIGYVLIGAILMGVGLLLFVAGGPNTYGYRRWG